MSGKDSKTKEEEKPKKVYKEKKRFPPLADMLAYGAPEDEGKPVTFMDKVWGPLILVVLFFISFLIFINAPIENSNGRPTFGMNMKPIDQEKRISEADAIKMREALKVEAEPVKVEAEPVKVEAEPVKVEEPVKAEEEPSGDEL